MPDIVTVPAGSFTKAASVELVALSAQYTGSVQLSAFAVAAGEGCGLDAAASGSPQAATSRRTATADAHKDMVFSTAKTAVVTASLGQTSREK
jgi:hypothetical protein